MYVIGSNSINSVILFSRNYCFLYIVNAIYFLHSLVPPIANKRFEKPLCVNNFHAQHDIPSVLFLDIKNYSE